MTATPFRPAMTGEWHPRLGFRMATPAPACDFCAVPLTDSWTRFGCRDFLRVIPAPVPLAMAMVGFWAGCDTCAPLVRARRWRDLIDHVTQVRVAAGIDDAACPEMRSELAALYWRLEQELTGTETLGGAL